jgi:hypothetical protein
MSRFVVIDAEAMVDAYGDLIMDTRIGSPEALAICRCRNRFRDLIAAIPQVGEEVYTIVMGEDGWGAIPITIDTLTTRGDFVKCRAHTYTDSGTFDVTRNIERVSRDFGALEAECQARNQKVR